MYRVESGIATVSSLYVEVDVLVLVLTVVDDSVLVVDDLELVVVDSELEVDERTSVPVSLPARAIS